MKVADNTILSTTDIADYLRGGYWAAYVNLVTNQDHKHLLDLFQRKISSITLLHIQNTRHQISWQPPRAEMSTSSFGSISLWTPGFNFLCLLNKFVQAQPSWNQRIGLNVLVYLRRDWFYYHRSCQKQRARLKFIYYVFNGILKKSMLTEKYTLFSWQISTLFRMKPLAMPSSEIWNLLKINGAMFMSTVDAFGYKRDS